MTKQLVKYRSLVAAVFMLMPLLFWFSYTELGQLIVENENTTTQDYCEIVKVTKTETGKVDLSDLLKLKVDKSVCPPCFNETNKYDTSRYQLKVEHLHSPQQTTEVYLYNRVFLI
jgi:hypothetical protein